MNTPISSSELNGRNLNRRDFLRAAAVVAAGVASGCQTTGSGAGRKDIDAHVHVWTPDLAKYPIHSSFKVADMQPPSFTPEQLFAHSKPAGVNRVVLIQMSFYQFDNRYMLDSMKRFPGTFSGVGIVDESVSGVQDRMRELASHGIRGFRIYPGKKTPDAWMGSDGMAAMWKAGADLGLAMCPLMGPDSLAAVGKMCEKFPKTRVVIDHFARIGVDGQIRDEQVDALCRLAKHPHVHVKTSAFYALGKKKAPYTDLGPMIRKVRDAFGAQRLMWASDCPYQVDPGHNYADSIALIRDRLDFLTASDREWMLRKTAEKVFFS
ncbi:MAG TPA: amidohydrolase family protein [Roseimicrobium sp.]|nr:amidohydrolase family protein [Roseimicrobium sp.]